jgi:hypothetical protein
MIQILIKYLFLQNFVPVLGATYSEKLPTNYGSPAAAQPTYAGAGEQPTYAGEQVIKLVWGVY